MFAIVFLDNFLGPPCLPRQTWRHLCISVDPHDTLRMVSRDQSVAEKWIAWKGLVWPYLPGTSRTLTCPVASNVPASQTNLILYWPPSMARSLFTTVRTEFLRQCRSGYWLNFILGAPKFCNYKCKCVFKRTLYQCLRLLFLAISWDLCLRRHTWRYLCSSTWHFTSGL